MSGRMPFWCIVLVIVCTSGNISVALDDVDLEGVRLIDFDAQTPLPLAAEIAEEPADGERREQPLLPPEALVILDRYEADSKVLRRKAEAEIDQHRQTLMTILQAMQDRYTREALLDEAVAIRDHLYNIRFAHLHPKNDPGNLTRFARRIGHTLYFSVTGVSQGTVWGTDVYTCDSNLAAAAVHAGVVRIGRRKVVKVTIVDSPEQHVGSQRHGVLTLPFGLFTASFKIEPADPNDINTDEDVFLDEEPFEQPNPMKNFGGLFLREVPREQPQLDLRSGAQR